MKNGLRRVTAFLMAVCLLVLLVPQEAQAGFLPSILTQKNYTVMVYMCGSNLESEGGCATYDIAEMAFSGVDFSRNNILVYTGGSSQWQLDLPNDKNSVIRLEEDGSYIVEAETDTAENMGEPETLTEFLEFAVEEFPAEHYALVLWDHGTGPVFGFGDDELFDYDGLLLPEWVEALEESPFGPDFKLDWIGFDACLMATQEVAASLADYADYLVASQETEPGDGWDYSFLSKLNETSDAKEITTAIVDTYGAYFEENATHYYHPEVTLSSLDLSVTEEMKAAMDGLFGAMEGGLDRGQYATYAKLRDETKCYGLSSTGGKDESLDLVDLGDLARRLLELYPQEAQAVLDAVDKIVVSETSNIRYSSGISLYYPYHNKPYYEEAARFLAADIESSEGYLSYLDRFTEIWIYGEPESHGIAWFSGDTQTTDEGLTLQLSEGELSQLSSAYYNILQETDPGVYTAVLGGCQIVPDANGVLHVPLEQELFELETDVEDILTVWPVVQLETDGVTFSYQTVNGLLLSSAEYFPMGGYEHVNINLSVTAGEDEVVITSVEYESEGAIHTGKNTVDVDNWDYVGFLSLRYLPTYDEDHNLLPFREWEDDGTLFLDSVPILDSFQFVKKDLAQEDGHYVCQIVFTDVNGNAHASELMEFQNDQSQTYHDITQAFGNGTLTSRIYDDHAEILNYESKPRKGANPAGEEDGEYEGVEDRTVTLIYGSETGSASSASGLITGAGPFTGTTQPGAAPSGTEQPASGSEQSGTASPDAVSSSDAGTSSGTSSGGFAAGILAAGLAASSGESQTGSQYTGIMRLPSTIEGVPVTRIAPEAFRFQNDVVELVVPESVTWIGQYAFSSCQNLKKVTLPSGLSSILSDTFYFCQSLKEVNIPEGVTYIGSFAFGECTSLEKLHIPAATAQILPGAFAGCVMLNDLSVAEDNAAYTCTDGMLITSDGKTLLACPGTGHVEVVIPEGVETISAYAFCGADDEPLMLSDEDMVTGLRRVTFPQSLKVIGNFAFYGCIYLNNLQIPENVERIGSCAFASKYGQAKTSIASLHLGAGLSYLGQEAFDGYRIRGYDVSEANLYFSSHRGFLMNKAQDTLLAVPTGLDFSMTIPDGVTTIKADFYQCRSVFTLTLSDSVTTIASSVNWPQNLQTLVVGSGLKNWGNLSAGRTLPKIRISQSNPYFSVENGVIYDKEKTTLLMYPDVLEDEAFIVPETVRAIEYEAFGYNAYLKELTIPAGLDSLIKSIFEGPFAHLESLEAIRVGEGDSYFMSDDGLLYSFDGEILLACPAGKEGTIRVREGTVVIGEDAFPEGMVASEVILPESVLILRSGNFNGVRSYGFDEPLILHLPASLTEISPACLTDGAYVTILCPEGSAAAAFADSMGLYWTEE